MTTLNPEYRAILKYVEDNPGVIGWNIALHFEAQHNRFRTATLLKNLSESGYLNREENAEERHFKYWRTDKAV